MDAKKGTSDVDDQLLTAIIAVFSTVAANAIGAVVLAYIGRKKTSAEVQTEHSEAANKVSSAAAAMVDALREEVERGNEARDKLLIRVDDLENKLTNERLAREDIRLKFEQLRADCAKDKMHMEAQIALLVHQIRSRGDVPLTGSTDAPG